jgi:hypothetical protein
MLTRLETTSGRLAVSAMKPAAITKASVAAGLKRSASSIAITIGVRISAAPSLANSAAVAAPSSTRKVNRRRPLPRPQRATCSAAQANRPASSSSRLMMISAMKVKVAFQTMSQTTGMSPTLTTPASRASAAPRLALQPTPRPRGCQMTSTRVAMKISSASSMAQCPGRLWGAAAGCGASSAGWTRPMRSSACFKAARSSQTEAGNASRACSRALTMRCAWANAAALV